jgi:hypothetical protein
VSEQQKSIGQVLYETMYHGHYPALGLVERAQWEARAHAVRTAVLAERAEPQGPKGMAEQEQDTATMVYHAARLTMAECRWFDAETQRLIGTAIERGVMAGLRAWEQAR